MIIGSSFGKLKNFFSEQKSRINWLLEGDLNTDFFHRIAQTRLGYNTIRSFLLSSGTLLLDPILMSNHAVNHFTSILAPMAMTNVFINPSWFRELFQFICSLPMQSAMVLMPTQDEIKRVLFKLKPNKSPGPDGLTSGFFKTAWSLIGMEFLTAVIHFFTSNFLSASANSTILTLVPKYPGASSIGDYRPISCLNTIYKVISRLLVRRLKPILYGFIQPNQTAFVQDRLLLENTVLAAEIMNGYHQPEGHKMLTLKINIAKAFDTVNWGFLFSFLSGIGLPPLFLRWLEACICTPSFMVGFNGMVHGYFKGKRGLRQGDHLSPYLFVIVMNCLSVMLNKAAQEGLFGFHPKCQRSKLTHLSFAYDLLIFRDGSLSSLQGVLMVLREFKALSGLSISISKTSFYSAGLAPGGIEAISVSTGLRQGSPPIRYLGVPLNTKKLSIANCEPLFQQIKSKISTWSARSLSFAGRLVLLNTVVVGITNFWSSSFILRKKCITTIKSMCGAFLWKGTLDGHHTARVSWDAVTKPKGGRGLGIRNLLVWNRACMMKLIWLLFFRSGSIWVAWFIDEVLDGNLSNYWIYDKRRDFSWLANKLLSLKASIFPMLKLQVGNGRTCLFWYHNWSPMGNLQEYLS